MTIIKFESYKQDGKIEYVTNEDIEISSAKETLSELDNIAQVMEMSTDEILSELTIRVNNVQGMRDVSSDLLVDELTQRLLAIEYVIFLTMAKHTKE